MTKVSTRVVLMALGLFCFTALTAAQDFILSSELKTSYFNGGESYILTVYDYDGNGNRIEDRNYNDMSSIVPPMSRTVYSYNSGGQLEDEYTISNGDTLSHLQYSYAPIFGFLETISTYDQNGNLKYVDSLTADMQRRPKRKTRWVGDQKRFYIEYTYAPGGLRQEALFEPDESNEFQVVQRTVITRNQAEQVIGEQYYVTIGGVETLKSTSIFTYENNLLHSVAEYAGNGQSKNLMDSLDYAYDSHGNKIEENAYNSDGVLKIKTTYEWAQMVPVIFNRSGSLETPQISMSGNLLHISSGNIPGTATISLFTLAGKRAVSKTITTRGITRVPLNGLACSGSYIVNVQINNTQKIIPLTISKQ